MDIAKKLEKLGIEYAMPLDKEIVRMIAYNVTEALVNTFPSISDEYNNIFAKLLNCDMYVATVTKPISKVNYIYENNSIYFDDTMNLNVLTEQTIHECIHYLQNHRSIKGRLVKIGLCNFENFGVSGLGLNEAAVQYISAKTVGNMPTILERYELRVQTISPNYYPFLTNLVEQIIYLMGEETIVNGTIKGDAKFEDDLLNTFEGNTKKIINRFDEIVEINNQLNAENDINKSKLLQQEIANRYIDTQNLIFSTYFEKICPRLNTVAEIDYYMAKATNYKNVMGRSLQRNFMAETFYDTQLKKITKELDRRLYKISKERSKNTLSIIRGDKLLKIIRKIVSYFSAYQ